MTIGSRAIADMIRETIEECREGYPDAGWVMEAFALDYAARMEAQNPTFLRKAFMRRALPRHD